MVCAKARIASSWEALEGDLRGLDLEQVVVAGNADELLGIGDAHGKVRFPVLTAPDLDLGCSATGDEGHERKGGNEQGLHGGYSEEGENGAGAGEQQCRAGAPGSLLGECGPSLRCAGGPLLAPIINRARLENGAVMGRGPVPQAVDGAGERVAQFGQSVFDPGGNFGGKSRG